MNLFTNQIIQGDCLEILKTMPDESIDCVITSPPYYMLRDYNIEGQLGLEDSPEEYIQRLVGVFNEVKRVLKKTGTCWVNISDSYGSENRKTGKQDSLSPDKYKVPEDRRIQGMNKSLIGIPFHFALGMINQGWLLRNTIIWYKPNCMPQSAKDRFTIDFEYVYFFTKNEKYFFEQQFEEFSNPENYRENKNMSPIGGKKQVKNGNRTYSGNTPEYSPLGRNKRCVWKVSTKPFSEAHFAVFPPDLIKPMILAGCPEHICVKCENPRKKIYDIEKGNWIPTLGSSPDAKKGGSRTRFIKSRKCKGLSNCDCNSEKQGFSPGIVLDPFMGSGTTALVALRLNRNFIGIELSKTYCQMSRDRINLEAGLLLEMKTSES